MVKTHIKKHRVLKYVFVIVIAAWLSLWVFHIQPDLYSQFSGPDERLRMLVPTYIYNHHALPTGYDQEVVFDVGNWSYAFYPQLLGALVSAGFMTIIGLFNDNATVLLLGARLSSVVFGLGTILVVGATTKRLLKNRKYSTLYSYFAMLALAFWPQFAFLSSYVNNDIVALFGVSLILYASVLGYQDKWNKRNGLILGLGFTVCLLGYTNSYGFVLSGVIFFLITAIKQNSKKYRNTYAPLIIVALIPIALAGPFYVRNALIYSGDFLGVSTFQRQTDAWEVSHNQKVQTSYREVHGGSILRLFRDKTYWSIEQKSFTAAFGYVTIKPQAEYLLTYRIFVGIGIIGFLALFISSLITRRGISYYNEWLLGVLTAFACVVTIGLSLYYSFTIDIQSQGRYIIYLLLPLIIASVIGYRYLLEKLRLQKHHVITILMICILYCLNTLVIFERFILRNV